MVSFTCSPFLGWKPSPNTRWLQEAFGPCAWSQKGACIFWSARNTVRFGPSTNVQRNEHGWCSASTGRSQVCTLKATWCMSGAAGCTTSARGTEATTTSPTPPKRFTSSVTNGSTGVMSFQILPRPVRVLQEAMPKSACATRPSVRAGARRSGLFHRCQRRFGKTTNAGQAPL